MAKVLIVEDELLIAEDLKHKLCLLGHTVVAQAATGQAALERACEAKPDLVLMDVRLLGSMDGLEAARRIREVKALPVVYVTAQSNFIKNISDAQQQFLLKKPFTIGQLDCVMTAACRAAAP